MRKITQFKHLVKYCDVFGQPIQMNLQNQNIFQTTLGGLVSLFTLFVFGLLFYRAAVNLLSRSEIQVIEREYMKDQPQIIDFSKQFMFAVKISDDQKREVDDLYHSLEQKILFEDGTQLTIPFNMTRCNKGQFMSISDFDFESLFANIKNKDLYYCPNFPVFQIDQKNLAIESYYIKLGVSICPLDIAGKECNIDRIQALMKKRESQFLQVEFIFTDFWVDNYQMQKVNPYLNKNYKVPFIPGIQTPMNDFILKKNLHYNDDSLVPYASEAQLQEFYTIHQESWGVHQVKIPLNNIKNLAEFTISASNKVKEINIKYQRIDTFLAYLGGILKILISVIGIIFSQYNKYSLYVQLANSLYSFNLPVSKDYLKKNTVFLNQNKPLFSYDILVAKINDRVNKAKSYAQILKTRIKHVISLNKLSHKPLVLEQEDNVNQIVDESPQNLNKEKQEVEKEILMSTELSDKYKYLRSMFTDILRCDTQVQMTFKYILAIVTCRKFFFKNNIQIQLIDKAVHMIQTDMDIMVMMDRLQDVDKLKKLLLTENQITLFNYIPKTVIRVEKSKGKNSQITFKTERKFVTRKEEDNEDDEEQGQEAGQRQKNISEEDPSDDQLLDKKLKFNSKEAFFKLYEAYFTLFKEIQHVQKKSNFKKLSNKLIELMGNHITQIFETSLLLYDPKQKFTNQSFQSIHLHHHNHSKVQYQFDQMLQHSHHQIRQGLEELKIKEGLPQDGNFLRHLHQTIIQSNIGVQDQFQPSDDEQMQGLEISNRILSHVKQRKNRPLK